MLAKAKLSVILLDQRPSLGGACSTQELAPGFRVPELSHSLGPVSRDVVKALRLDRAAGLEFITPDPSLTSIGDDGHVAQFSPRRGADGGVDQQAFDGRRGALE